MIDALAVGLTCGAVPMIIGISKKQVGLGVGGFIACIISGVLLGLILALPVCIWFVSLIYNASQEQQVQGQNISYMKCPYCAEQILSEAKICRYCNRDLLQKDNSSRKMAIKKSTDNPSLVLCSSCGHQNWMGNTKCSRCLALFDE